MKIASFFENIKSKFKKKELPSVTDFPLLRNEYINNCSRTFLQELRENKNESVQQVLEELSDEKKEQLSKLYAHLEFGIVLAHQQMGLNFKKKDIVTEGYDYYHAGFMSYVPEGKIDEMKDVFLLALNKMIALINNEQELEKMRNHWEIPELTLNDFLFLVGVEESAHRAFYHKKNMKVSISAESAPSYHSSDEEYRALLWKLDFVKKYFPQYEESFRLFFQKNTALRSSFLNEKRSNA